MAYDFGANGALPTNRAYLFVRAGICVLMFKFIMLCMVVISAYDTVSCAVAQEIRLDQIQDIGTHNSYRAGLDPMMQGFLQRQKPDLARLLDYQHPSLPAQFDAGIRQIELDIYADSKGGVLPIRGLINGCVFSICLRLQSMTKRR